MTDINPLRAELRAWQKVRRTYPGWLVVPANNRGTLVWEIDQGLQGGLIHALISGILPDWSPEERLIAWSELNWRLERALLPLPPDWAEKIEAVLAEIAPCPELIATNSTFFGADAENFICRADLRWPWVELAAAILRHHREFRHEVPFQTWHTRLAPLDTDWDWVHRYRAYQNALWQMTFMNDAQALRAVETWDAERGGDPYWLARKAGLLVELGEKRQALELLQECRRRLQGADNDERPFFSTSRESAVVQALLWLSDDNNNLDRNELECQLRILSNIDGWSYWNELGVLSKLDLEYRERMEKRKADIDVPFWEAPSLWKPVAGVQCFRLAEELGFPLREHDRGGSSTHGITSALKESFADLALASEDLAATSLMRIRDTDFWKQRLDSAHLAVLPDNLLADLRLACANAWRQVEDLQPTSSQAQATVIRAKAILCQLRCRMDGNECKDWFSRLLSVGNRTVFHGDFRVAEHLQCALKCIADGIESDQLIGIILASLSFPLPEEAQVDDRWWPEPLDGIHLVCNGGAVLPSEVLPRIASLVERAPASRSALFRLAILSEAGLLPSELAEKLAGKLWGVTDDLPNIVPLPLLNLLALPEPQPGHAGRAIASWFVKNPPPGLNDSSKREIRISSSDWFSDLHGVSTPYRRPPGSRFVPWSAVEAETLLSHAEAWWRDEGQEWLSTKKGRPFADLLYRRLFYRRLYGVRRSLARAIAPNLAPGSAAGKIRLPQLLDQIAECGYPVLSVRPLLLRFKVGDVESMANQLIDGLRSRDKDTVTDALWGVVHWYEFKKDAKLQTIPHRLIEQLLIFLAARADGNAATEVIATIKAILDHDDQAPLTTRAKELLALALDGLQGRATYPDTWHQRDGLRYTHTVDLRRNAVLLASAVHKAGICDTESVQYWLEQGCTDPLPIVRQALKT